MQDGIAMDMSHNKTGKCAHNKEGYSSCFLCEVFAMLAMSDKVTVYSQFSSTRSKKSTCSSPRNCIINII